jgi:ribosomal protein S18 acetylase RimI-like enzyme
MIRKGTIKDIDAILNITKACATHMINKQIYQWNEHYPNKSGFENDIKRKELVVIEINFELIGCITISTYMDDEYMPVSWLTPNENNLYIHRLAIHPKFQGKGYAQKLMDYAENYAKTNSFASIRLDTFSKNERNQKFYEARGYQRLGNIMFPKQSNYPFYCYELVL